MSLFMVSLVLKMMYFYIYDKKIHFEAPIDMVNKDIENVMIYQ